VTLELLCLDWASAYLTFAGLAPTVRDMLFELFVVLRHKEFAIAALLRFIEAILKVILHHDAVTNEVFAVLARDLQIKQVILPSRGTLGCAPPACT